MPYRFKQFVTIIIFLIFAIFVEQLYGWAALLTPWRDFSPTTIAAAVLLTFVTYWLRALRVYDCYREVMRGRFLWCVKLTLTHNLLNNLLPMRMGEFSFPVLMTRYFQVSAVHSVPMLFWFRLLDLHTLGAFAILAVGRHIGGPWMATGLLVVWLVLLLPICRAGPWLRGRWGATEGNRIRHTVLLVLDALPGDTRTFWRTWAWTVVNWVIKLAIFTWVLGLFLKVPVRAALLAVIAGDLTSILPIHGVAGTGTYETGVITALLLFNVDTKAALAAAVNLHLFILGSTLAGGVVSLLIRPFCSNGSIPTRERKFSQDFE